MNLKLVDALLRSIAKAVPGGTLHIKVKAAAAIGSLLVLVQSAVSVLAGADLGMPWDAVVTLAGALLSGYRVSE